MKHLSGKSYNYKKFNPAVDKKNLMLLSGLIWSGIGLFLLSLAYRWLLNFDDIIIYYLGGFLLAFFIHSFGFKKIAQKNINRILNMKTNKICLFAFQPWKSYAIIVIMMSLGNYLRNSSIPKNYLAIIYFGIGGALFLSSLIYYKKYFKLIPQ